MAEYRSVGEMMREKATEAERAKRLGGAFLAERPVRRTPLGGKSRYSFCPSCAERARRESGADWMGALRPLWVVTYRCLVRTSETTGKVCYDRRWECPECGRRVTEDDFIRAYAAPYEDTAGVVDLTKLDLDSPSLALMF